KPLPCLLRLHKKKRARKQVCHCWVGMKPGSLCESPPRKRQRVPLPCVQGKRRLREGRPFLLRRLWPRPPRCSRSRCRSSLVLRRRLLRQETCSRWPKDSVCALLSRPRVQTAVPFVIPGSSMVESKRRENSGPTGRILQKGGKSLRRSKRWSPTVKTSP